MYLEKLSGEVSQGDVFGVLPFAPVVDGPGEVRRVSAMLLTQDCEYDKPSAASVPIAGVMLLSGIASGSQGNVRRNRVASAFYLPTSACQSLM